MRQPVGYVKRRKRDGKLRWIARIAYTEKATGRLVDRLRVAHTKHEADGLLDDLRAEYRRHGRIETDKRFFTFSDLANLYEETKVFPAEYHHGRKTSGIKSHYQVSLYLDVLRAHFGNKRVREIKHSDIVAFRRERLKTKTRAKRERAIASVNRELETLRAMLRFAVRGGYIEQSPFEQGEPLIIKQHEAKRERVLSWDEETKLLAQCVGRYQHLRGLIIVGVDTGMRRGELFTLTWSDVDLDEGLIRIRPEVEKTNRGRNVAMTSRVSDEIHQLWAIAERPTEGLVFGVTSTIKNGWKTICKEAGIKNLRFHDLRHTCVTRMVEAGVPLAQVMKQVGHKTLAMLSRYLNPGEESAKATAEALNAVIKVKVVAVQTQFVN